MSLWDHAESMSKKWNEQPPWKKNAFIEMPKEKAMENNKMNYRPVLTTPPGTLPKEKFMMARDITPHTIVLWGPDKVKCKGNNFYEGAKNRYIKAIDSSIEIDEYVSMNGYVLIEEDPRCIFPLSKVCVGDVVKKADRDEDNVYLCIACGSSLALTKIYGGNSYTELFLIDEHNENLRVYQVELAEPESANIEEDISNET